MSTKPKAGSRARKRAEAVTCGHCYAQPTESCEGPEGFKCSPHSVRIARSNGLLPTPRRGCYGRASIVFGENELRALEDVGGVP